MSAQKSTLPAVIEIVSVEEDGNSTEIVNIPKEGVNHYYLHVGAMGFGNKAISVNLDPVDRLYVPLGSTLAEAISTMEELKTLYKEPKGTSREIQASFGPFLPKDSLKTVKVERYQPLLTNYIAFTLSYGGSERAAHLSKSEFNSLLSGLKLHKKLHPKEK